MATGAGSWTGSCGKNGWKQRFATALRFLIAPVKSSAGTQDFGLGGIGFFLHGMYGYGWNYRRSAVRRFRPGANSFYNDIVDELGSDAMRTVVRRRQVAERRAGSDPHRIEHEVLGVGLNSGPSCRNYTGRSTCIGMKIGTCGTDAVDMASSQAHDGLGAPASRESRAR